MNTMTMTTASSTSTKIKHGFSDAVFESQAIFRSAMLATAYPGRVISIEKVIEGPVPFAPATASLCLTLMDFETSVWLQSKTEEVSAWLRFHCGLPVVDETGTAAFAIVTDPQNMPSLTAFHQGDIEYPERSTTLIIQVPSLTRGPETTWSGPGINGTIAATIAGLPLWFWSLWDLNRELYPRGLDIVFACGNELIGLPRTVAVVETESAA
ncbi:phosphonate C-P lyase system protein PhnH [Rhizobium leguminosarum]|uniref:phosphonate C-P lyase system protein PhnH n=1 Tax=Rhizobium leguminosarum TaxID=384 RepID=UPI0021BBF59F|nr:phosphonate C-P lyase system protein PhnH [Rhizobium leguminosarum]